MKQRTCRFCKQKYTPSHSLQPYCGSFECKCAYAISLANRFKKNREQAERKELKERKEKLKTRRDYIKEAQIAFNAYIRERDKDKPCICCGLPLGSGEVGGAFDCGHYRSVGSAPHLRFDERNAHGQRKQCNRYGAGRAVDYRIGLIARIGAASVEALEADQQSRDHSIEALKAIKALYVQKRKELMCSSSY